MRVAKGISVCAGGLGGVVVVGGGVFPGGVTVTGGGAGVPPVVGGGVTASPVVGAAFGFGGCTAAALGSVISTPSKYCVCSGGTP